MSNEVPILVMVEKTGQSPNSVPKQFGLAGDKLQINMAERKGFAAKLAVTY
jgi:hypothetical protein